MRLVDAIAPEYIVPAVRATHKDDVIRELAGHLADQLGGKGDEEIARVLMQREAQGSTAVGEGVAVPHAKYDSLNRLVVCLGRSRRGVDFGAADRAPVHFFFVVLSPPDAAGAHLKLLARFSQIFKNAPFRKKLMAAKTGEAMYQIIAGQDGR